MNEHKHVSQKDLLLPLSVVFLAMVLVLGFVGLCFWKIGLFL